MININEINNAFAHILVVDDDPFILKSLSFSLQGMGCMHVATVNDVSQALALLQTHQPPVDIIISDLNIPGIDGVEFFRRLVDCGFAGGLILISGEDSRILAVAENLAKARQLNVLGTVAKPVKQEALRPLINGWSPPPPIIAVDNPVVSLGVLPEALKLAIKVGELEPWYQPKIDLATGRMVGVEALARWLSPSQGMIYPDQFIPVAEQHGLIDALTMLMLSKALAQAKHWQQRGLELCVAVNVSMDNLYSLDFPDRVGGAIKEAGLEGASISLEVTESRLMQELAGPMDNLVRLRLKRVGLSIDDFGTGHSNLEQLRELPFDELKLDRSFVHGAAESETARVILEASVALAKRLGMVIVAEGVENEADWNRVVTLGCDQAQGYFMARPMPGADIAAWAESWKESSRQLKRKSPVVK